MIAGGAVNFTWLGAPVAGTNRTVHVVPSLMSLESKLTFNNTRSPSVTYPVAVLGPVCNHTAPNCEFDEL